ncbi:hypothetical protein F2Q68_00030832 [Brassica cretica]|uniref:CCHC-type domain-containing protein n=1 Tax=Brassica cretica TaxID=69181 RepID=A0A8S9GAA3_BRACR|nr:hypothetical protein F2Q68_00030832 [Brassica cretica]
MPPRQARRGGDYLPIPISSSSDSSPPSTPAPLPTPSFEATPSGSSFETDPSKGSYDQTPVHMPLSPDPYFMDIEVDVVHDSPVHGDHPAAPASPAAHIPPAPAAPIPAAQPEPAPTDPAITDKAIIALLELMAEMMNLQLQALNAQRDAQHAQPAPRAVNVEEAIAAERASSTHSAPPRCPSVPFHPQPHSAIQRGRGGRAFQGRRSGGPRPRTPTCFTCGQLGHVRRDFPNVGLFQPAVPSHITCFTCGERGHYATSCPRTHLAQPVVSSARPVGPVNPPLPLPPAKRQATAGRAYALELPRPSGPPQAQPEPAPTDPAIIALLELMAEMVNLQHQALNAQRDAQLEFHRLAYLVERAVNVEEAIAAERASSTHSAPPRRPSVPFQPQPHSAMQRGRGGRAFRGGRFGGPRPRTPTCFTCGQQGHVRRDCPNVGQFKPAVPSRITCFTCGERGNHATSCPRTHLARPVVSSARPVRPVNPPLPLPPAKSQATAGRAYALELPGPSGPPQGPISGLFSYPIECCIIFK